MVATLRVASASPSGVKRKLILTPCHQVPGERFLRWTVLGFENECVADFVRGQRECQGHAVLCVAVDAVRTDLGHEVGNLVRPRLLRLSCPPDPTSSSGAAHARHGDGSPQSSVSRPQRRPACCESGHADSGCRSPYSDGSARSAPSRFPRTASKDRPRTGPRCSSPPPDRRSSDPEPSSEAE
jgi:hypothetical protein